MITAHHTSYVVDASVLVKWFLYQQEVDRDRALALRDLHIAGRSTIIIPQLALLEVLNAVRFSPKAKEEDGETALEALHDLNMDARSPDLALLRKANAIAWVKAINDYRSGVREEPMMLLMVGALTDEDVANLAAYYSTVNCK